MTLGGEKFFFTKQPSFTEQSLTVIGEKLGRVCSLRTLNMTKEKAVDCKMEQSEIRALRDAASGNVWQNRFVFVHGREIQSADPRRSKRALSCSRTLLSYVLYTLE